MYDESAPKGASENLGGDLVQYLYSRISSVLSGEREPHELPAPLHDLWRDAFTCGQIAAGTRVARAEHAADVYYDLAFNGDAARERHAEMLKHFDVMQARKKAVAP